MTKTLQPRRHAGFTGKIGIARSDITPPVGIYSRNWGAAAHDVATSIHRPLLLTVLSIQNGDLPPLVLVDADLGWWRPLSLFERFRDRLLKEIQIPPAHLIFALTHTHAAAPLMEPQPELPGSELQEEWLEDILTSAKCTINTAIQTAFLGSLDWHQGTCHLASTRDLPDPHSERFLCGYDPDGNPDSTLVIGRVTGLDGQLRAVITNYACHPTTLAWDNEAISPDYIGAMRETIENSTGATSFFLQGASGELAPPFQYVGEPEVADRHGRQLGFATLATLHDMEPPGTELAFEGVVESGAPLAVWKPRPYELPKHFKAVQETVELKLKNWPSVEDLERQRSECQDRALEERLRRRRDIRRVVGNGTTSPVPVTAWKIGDAIVIGSCCEAYSLLQRELRRRFPEHPVACMNLMNGTIGYLPPQERYDLDLYQVWQTPFECGGLETLIEFMSEMIENLIK